MSSLFTSKPAKAAASVAIKKDGGFQSFLQNPRLTTSDLRKGDILIVKLYEGAQYWEDVDRRAPYSDDYGHDGMSIVAAQSVFSRMRHGSATSEHAMLIAADGTEGNYESVGCGVNLATKILKRWHAVYRPVAANKALADQAAYVAHQLSRPIHSGSGQLQDSASPLAQGMESSVQYRSKVSMAASIFRPRFSGLGTNSRLRRVHEIAYGDRQELRTGLKMICSEFVATCYEVAAMQLGKPSVFGNDPRALTAKALDAALYRCASYFPMMGIYEGSDSIVRLCPTCQGEVRCMYVQDQAGNRCTTLKDGKQVFPYVTICPNCNKCPTCFVPWTAKVDPSGGTGVVFFCEECDGGGTSNASSTLVNQQGGQIAMGGFRKKPDAKEDRYFIR